MKSTALPAGGLLGALLGLAVGVAAAAMLFPFSVGGADVREGDRAPRAYRAQHAVQYESEVVTEQLRAQEAGKVADVYFPPDPTVAANQQAAVAALFDGLESLRRSNLGPQQKLTDAQNLPGASEISPAVLGSILDFDDDVFQDFQSRTELGIATLMDEAVLTPEVSVVVSTYLEADRPQLPSEYVALRELLNTFVVQNVIVDADATDAAREEARAGVQPQIATYVAGQVVAQEGERLDAALIEALEETGIITSGVDRYRVLGGLVVGLGVALLIGGGAAMVTSIEPPVGRKLFVIGAAVILALIVARAAFPFIFPDRERLFIAFAIPFAAAALLTSVLAGFSFAAIVSVSLGLLIAFIAATVPDLPGSRFAGPLEAFELAAAVAVAGLAAAPFVSGAHSLMRWAGAAIAAALAVAAVLGAVWLFSTPRDDSDLAVIALAAAIHGVGAAFLAATATWALGGWLDVRLRDPIAPLIRGDHPLLHRLQDEAPGTYHHSMMVASLSEAAARRIGADPDLARVGAMFHDIGKLAQPRYYIENTLEHEPSPHTNLSPELSAAHIRDHVTNGLALARRSGLPDEVSRFIPEHHGTRLILYFYREAVRESPVVDAAAFRYAGPRPQSRETAIVMLADSCEATVRATQPSIGDEVDRTVDEILAERIAEGELDESGLSVADVRVIAATFKESLRALHHRRIPYPPALTSELAGIA